MQFATSPGMADSDKARAEPESPESEQRRDESEV
jgi:hypothetical protein